MHTNASHQAAETIWTHWQNNTRLDALSPELRPTTRQEGYAVQAMLPTVASRTVLGWKIAATSAVGQAHINVSGPMAGRILSGQVLQDGDEVPSLGNWMRVAEPEIAFVMQSDLSPRKVAYSLEEVMQAVGALHPSLEIPNSRYTVFTAVGEAQLAADNACAHQFILGPKAPESWRALDLSKHAVHAQVTASNGAVWKREGTGAAGLGDPRSALTWLVNELTSQGISLHAGQFVTTGTCMTPLELNSGDTVDADFGVLGKVGLRFK
jgi:2-keto-4-pentenoate hydratase